VTHHAEEIMPSFTHALLLKEGAVFASGPKVSIITSRKLGGAFGAHIRVHGERGRFAATVGRHGGLGHL
jgi:iron complex transport system ATP-binding protein